MFERDYLMRLITQAAAALGRLMGLKEQKKHDEAIELIDEFLSREMRMRTRLALSLTDEGLFEMLSVAGVPNLESIAILGAFLQAEGDMLYATGRIGDAVQRYEKALRLLVYALREGGPIKELRMDERIRELSDRLMTYKVSSDTKRAVWYWQESQGRFADAENMLYELHDEQSVTFEEGRFFYERLKRLDDVTLENGGLPRSEIREGIEQWTKLHESTNHSARQV